MRKVRRGTVLAWRWRRNPLRRHSDAVEGWVVLATWLVAVAGGTAAGALGAHAVGEAVDQQRQQRQPVAAVLLQTTSEDPRDPATGSRYDHVQAKVRWTDGDGAVRTGTTSVETGVKAGTGVPAWTDGHGHLVSAPLSASEAAARVVLTGAAVAAAGGLAVLVGGRVVRLRIERRATESWGAEWARVEPQWRRKTS
ncbi:hypothetical protein ACFSL4_13770 [Streptomyces caeni]|uniref:Uncharacterized protein n=1 Tax=Streptomyces caeni TaxID=2307231 RepID=A0ABW4IR91_9ACTN